MPARKWLLSWWPWACLAILAIPTNGNPMREPLCSSPTEFPHVHGELEIGRVPLRVNRSTLTTDCRGVSFGNATSRNDTDTTTCIWFPNTTVISTADVNCSTADNDLLYLLRGSSATIQVDLVQDFPSSFSTIVLERLGILAVGPNLTHDSTGRVVSASRIQMKFNAIASIDGVQWPFETRVLQLDYNTIEAIGDIATNNTQLTTLSLVGNRIQALDDTMVLPPNLAHLHLDFNQITTLDSSITFPASLRHLSLTGNRLKSLPPGEVLPSALATLDLSFNLLTRLDVATALPVKLTTLDASFNKITQVVANFPPTLTTLCLAGNNITAFYANQSQFDLLSQLANANPNATFDANHSIDDPCSLVLTTTTTNATCVNHSRVQLLWNTFPMCIVEDDDVLPRLAIPTAQPTENEPPAPNLLVWVAVGLGAAGGVALIALLVVGWRRRRRDHRSPHSWQSMPSAFDGMATWRVLQSPAPLLVVSSSGSSVSAVSSDIRFDTAMQHLLLPATTVVHRKRVLESGGNGIVYLVSLTDDRHTSRLAAMKCILPSLATDTAAIADFMHEMRLTASLAHPHVVTFVGLAWTSLHDLSVMTEYMDGGDLWNVLTVTRPPQLAWHLPRALGLEEALHSQPNGGGAQHRRPFSKLSVVLDVAEALAYLHSLPHVVVHRDLKAKNVLLDGSWTAKLGDFGSSAVLAGQQPHADRARMTGGTVPWTAPEVLRSDQALEAADVFAFGVLLSEVDTARIPYSHHAACVPGDDVTVEMARARVAMLVLGGTVTPQFSDECPDSIRDMAMRCLAYHPDDRPTADQLVQWCQVLLSYQTDIY